MITRKLNPGKDCVHKTQSGPTLPHTLRKAALLQTLSIQGLILS
jgi:hypothetical protein